MALTDFISAVHQRTPRNYLERVSAGDKAHCAQVAKQFGQEYWDGPRTYGYGGYHYDGRWRPVAERLVAHYGIKPGQRILDIGCGKGHLLYEFTQVVPGVEVLGLDISEYALTNAKPEIANHLHHGTATHLPFSDAGFDLVVSINVLHNLYNFDLRQALCEIERVGRGGKYIVVDSYRTEREKLNLLNWQLTCECFYTPAEWEWFFHESGYTGDHGYVFFE